MCSTGEMAGSTRWSYRCNSCCGSCWSTLWASAATDASGVGLGFRQIHSRLPCRSDGDRKEALEGLRARPCSTGETVGSPWHWFNGSTWLQGSNTAVHTGRPTPASCQPAPKSAGASVCRHAHGRTRARPRRPSARRPRGSAVGTARGAVRSRLARPGQVVKISESRWVARESPQQASWRGGPGACHGLRGRAGRRATSDGGTHLCLLARPAAA